MNKGLLIATHLLVNAAVYGAMGFVVGELFPQPWALIVTLLAAAFGPTIKIYRPNDRTF